MQKKAFRDRIHCPHLISSRPPYSLRSRSPSPSRSLTFLTSTTTAEKSSRTSTTFPPHSQDVTHLLPSRHPETTQASKNFPRGRAPHVVHAEGRAGGVNLARISQRAGTQTPLLARGRASGGVHGVGRVERGGCGRTCSGPFYNEMCTVGVKASRSGGVQKSMGWGEKGMSVSGAALQMDILADWGD